MAVHQRRRLKPLQIDDSIVLDIEELILQVRREMQADGLQDKRFSTGQVLSFLITYALSNLSKEQLKEMIKQSNSIDRKYKKVVTEDDGDDSGSKEVVEDDLLEVLPR